MKDKDCFFFFLILEMPDLKYPMNVSICTIIIQYCIKVSSLPTQMRTKCAASKIENQYVAASIDIVADRVWQTLI